MRIQYKNTTGQRQIDLGGADFLPEKGGAQHPRSYCEDGTLFSHTFERFSVSRMRDKKNLTSEEEQYVKVSAS